MVNSIQATCPTRAGRRLFPAGALYWAFAMLFGVNAGLHPIPLNAQARAGYVATEYVRIDNPGATQVIRSMNSTNVWPAGTKTTVATHHRR